MISVALTPAQFAAKVEQLREEEGIELVGKSGTMSNRGVTAEWSYDGTKLSVTITHKPFLVTTEYCEHQLLAWLASPPE